MVISIFLFFLEIFYFDLKVLLVNIPFVGSSSTLVNLMGISIFFLHLTVVWYWAFRSMGRILKFADYTTDYVRENVRFNLVLVVIWLVLSLVGDFLVLANFPWLPELMDSLLFQILSYALFLILLLMFAPVLITFLWKCESLPEGDLKDSISALRAARPATTRSAIPGTFTSASTTRSAAHGKTVVSRNLVARSSL